MSRNGLLGRNPYCREDGLLGRMLGQGPVRDVNAVSPGIVKLDEGVRRVVGRTIANPKFIDFDGADVPNLFGRSLGLFRGACLVPPRGVRNEIAVKGRLS